MTDRNTLLRTLALGTLLSVSSCVSREKTVEVPTQSSPSSASKPSVSEVTQASPPRLLMLGRINCKTKTVFVTEGLFGDEHFQDLRHTAFAIENKKYDGSVFIELEKIKICELAQRDFDSYPEQPPGRVFDRSASSTLLLEATLDKLSIPFSLSEVTFDGFDSLATYLKDVRGEEGCKPISENCMKCSKKIYCQSGKDARRE